MNHPSRFTRNFSLLFVLLFLFTLFACASPQTDDPSDPDTETTSGAETTPSEGTEPPYDLDLPEGLDFGGQTVRILSAFAESTDTKTTPSGYSQYAGELCVEDLTSDPVNDAVFNRELFVEDRLNVNIELVGVPKGQGTCNDYLSFLQASGDVVCELATDSSANIVWATSRGIARDLTTVDNLNLENPWWSQNFSDECSIGGRVFFATGDIALSTLRLIHVVLFNKDVAENHHVENLYQTVFDGNWTIDTLTEISSEVYRDLNGNSEVDSEDEFGLAIADNSCDAFWAAFDLKIFGKDDTDHLVYVLNDNREKVINAIEKVRKLVTQKSCYHEPSDDRRTDYPYRAIANGSALFAFARLGHTESNVLRNMSGEYGVLPFPKYDKSQSDYYSFPHDDFTCFCIPSTLSEEDADMTGAVMEAMGWYSKCYITPVYLDIALKGKYANDPETRKVIDILTAGVKIEAAWEYAYITNDMPQMIRDFIDDPNIGIASEIQKKESRIEKQVWALNYAIDELP